MASIKCESMDDDRDTLLDEYNHEMDEKNNTTEKSNIRSSLIKQNTMTDLKRVRISAKESHGGATSKTTSKIEPLDT